MSELEEGLLAGQLDEQDEKEKAESGMSLLVPISHKHHSLAAALRTS